MVGKLYDIMQEHFFVAPKQGDDEEGPEAPETVEEAGARDWLEPDDSDLEDAELAYQLGAPIQQGSEGSETSASIGGSRESLHTGLTDELEEKLSLEEASTAAKPVLEILSPPRKKQNFGNDNAAKIARMAALRL